MNVADPCGSPPSFVYIDDDDDVKGFYCIAHSQKIFPQLGGEIIVENSYDAKWINN